MQIVLTGRQVTVSQKLRAQVEAGLTRVEKIVGRKSTAHVVLSSTKHGKVVDVTVKAKLHDLSSKCEEPELEMALHNCLDKVEKQALKHKNRLATRRRHPEKNAVGSVRLQTSDEALKSQPGVAAARLRGNGKAAPKKAVAKKKSIGDEFPADDFTEPHLIRTTKGVARRPMGIEEAVKVAQDSDRSVFVFRDLDDQAIVLHLLGNGRVEVIEVP